MNSVYCIIIIVLQVLILWILSLFIVIGVGIAAAVLTTDVSIYALVSYMYIAFLGRVNLQIKAFQLAFTQ